MQQTTYIAEFVVIAFNVILYETQYEEYNCK